MSGGRLHCVVDRGQVLCLSGLQQDVLLSQHLSLAITVTEDELREVHTATQCREWENPNSNTTQFKASSLKVGLCWG